MWEASRADFLWGYRENSILAIKQIKKTNEQFPTSISKQDKANKNIKQRKTSKIKQNQTPTGQCAYRLGTGYMDVKMSSGPVVWVWFSSSACYKVYMCCYLKQALFEHSLPCGTQGNTCSSKRFQTKCATGQEFRSGSGRGQGSIPKERREGGGGSREGSRTGGWFLVGIFLW